MVKQSVTVEWTVVDEQPGRAAEPESNTAENVRAASRAANRREMYAAAVVLFLSLTVMGIWHWGKRNSLTTANEIQEAVVLNRPTQSAGARPNENQVATDIPAAVIGEYARLGNRGMAQVIVHTSVEREVRAYRETQFFEQTPTGWQRIDPDPALMGPLRSLQMPHFTLHYRAMDAGVVQETAPKLEEFYANLRRDFGLPAARHTDLYQVELVAESVTGGYRYDFAKRLLVVPSPALLSVPEEMAATTVLYQSLAQGVAHLVVAEARRHYQREAHSNFTQWFPLENGLRLWALWAEGGPLADTHITAVRWYYHDGTVSPSDARSPSLDELARLCRTYAIWRMSPQDHSIQAGCAPGATPSLQRDEYSYLDTWQPEQLNLQNLTLGGAFQNTVSTATILEYIVAVYGKDFIPLLLTAIGEHTKPDTLIPALFDLSIAEFESDWRLWLMEQYGERATSR